MDNRSGPRHRFSAIPGVPGRYNLIIPVPHNLVDADLPVNVLDMATGSAQLANWSSCPEILRTKYGNSYVFGEAVDGDDQELITIWNPRVDTEDRLTPVKEVPDTIGMSWPPVLIKGVIVMETQDGASVPVDRYLWVDGYDHNATCVRRTYISNTKFTKEEVATDSPQPTSVRAVQYGISLNKPDCLHPEVIVRNLSQTVTEYESYTPSVDSPTNLDAVVYPETNHLVWQDHIRDTVVTEANGLYIMVQTEVIAPDMPEPADV